jgi:hypothetical protein
MVVREVKEPRWQTGEHWVPSCSMWCVQWDRHDTACTQ